MDAGYLYAQGSAAIYGTKKPRMDLQLDVNVVISYLQELAAEKSQHRRLLRIYWYDGASALSHLTSDQTALANCDNVKLRLGFINSNGQQKGVDSLIVTDLIELARLQSISDAVLLSGDEDVRIGVQIAQSYGVRVHLLGIAPSRGSQSTQLIQEADTKTEWSQQDVSCFLSLREGATPSELVAAATAKAITLETIVDAFVGNLTITELQGVSLYWTSGSRGVPPDLDRKLLPTCRDALGRLLEAEEIREMRLLFAQSVRQRLPQEA